jgi:hypothetical protein
VNGDVFSISLSSVAGVFATRKVFFHTLLAISRAAVIMPDVNTSSVFVAAGFFGVFG